MTQSLTDRLQEARLTVVEVDPEKNRLRLKGDACRDVACHAETVVVTDDGVTAGLGALNPGDIVKVEPASGPPQRIVVVRRVWEELASPEL